MAKLANGIKQDYRAYIMRMKLDGVSWAFCRASGVTVIFKVMPKNKFVQVAVSYCSPDDEFKKKIGLVVAAMRWYEEGATIQVPMRYSDKKLVIDNFMRKTLHQHGCDEYDIRWAFEHQENEQANEPQENKWFSNVGRDSYEHPCELCWDTKIEVKYRNGVTETGRANSWFTLWKETDGTEFNIVAYRVL